MAEQSNLDKKLLDDVETYGWHVIKVMADETGPGFGYSVGFFRTFGHPEAIIIGLGLDLRNVYLWQLIGLRKFQIFNLSWRKMD